MFNNHDMVERHIKLLVNGSTTFITSHLLTNTDFGQIALLSYLNNNNSILLTIYKKLLRIKYQ